MKKHQQIRNQVLSPLFLAPLFWALLFLALLPPVSLALGNTPQPLRVIDRGQDGDLRLYTVYCPDGKRTAVQKYYLENRVCTRTAADQTTCKQWSVDEAARFACK